MALIDLDKFLASFIEAMKAYRPVSLGSLPFFIKKALEDQGLEYRDGEIVKTQDIIAAESEDEKIKKRIIQAIKIREKEMNEEWSDEIAWLEKQGNPKFKVGDIISNGKVIYRIDGITKNCLGQDSYFLVNIEDEEKGLRHLILTDPEGKRHYFGETEWLCEQVDRQFWIKKD